MNNHSEKILSVITVNLNDCAGLEKTVKSVKEQNSPFIEHLVIDGDSNDGSKDFIEKEKDYFAYSISEQDNGVYDAQNKGILASKGKYLIFLNSGDTFYSSTVVSEFMKFAEVSHGELIYGNSNVTNPKGKTSILIQPKNLNLEFWYRNTLNHQSVFFSKSLFLKYGNYNTRFKFSSDFEFLFKLFLNNPKTFVYFNEVICNYSECGLSANPKNYQKIIEEKELILRENLNDKDYFKIKKQYRANLPLKQQLLLWIYDKPILAKIFKNLYNSIKR